MYQLTKTLPADIAPHIYSSLRDLGVIFDKSILSIIPKLDCADPEGTADACYGT